MTVALSLWREELERRVPGYLARHPANVTAWDVDVLKSLPPAMIACHGLASLRDAIAETIGAACKDGVARVAVDGRACPLGRLLALTAADCSIEPLLAPDAPDRIESPPGYDRRKTVAGDVFLESRSGSRPVLLMNAASVTTDLWSRAFRDGAHDWRLIVPLDPDRDQALPSAQRESRALAALGRIVQSSGAPVVDLIAWCSGARRAIAFAAASPVSVGHLVLLSPDLAGTPGFDSTATAHAEVASTLLRALIERPQQRSFLTRLFASQASAMMSGTSFARSDETPAATALWERPPVDRIAAMNAPLVDPCEAIRFAERVMTERGQDVVAALTRIDSRILLLGGASDSIVGAEQARAVLTAADRRFVDVSIAGGGHLIHDLQYPYFRHVVTAFLEDRPIPLLARVVVEHRDLTAPQILAPA